MTTAVPFNTGHPSAVSRSRQLKAALQVFSHYKIPLTFRYSWKRLRKRRSKNLIKFPQVYIAFVLLYVHCFEKKNTYWLNESWETRLPKRLKCTIVGIFSLCRFVEKVCADRQLPGYSWCTSIADFGLMTVTWSITMTSSMLKAVFILQLLSILSH